MATTTGSENVSRGDMIQWINETLKCFGTGAIVCQLIDYIYPGKVQLSKVNWKAKLEYEFVSNFKILQQIFTKIGVNKPIPIEKLTKCKYQDNLEFAQWIKKYFDQHIGDNKNENEDYDPQAKRGNVEIDFSYIEGKGNPASATASLLHSKDSSVANKTTSQLKKQVAPRYATSIMISTNSNELNKSQNLNESKEDNQQKQKALQQQLQPQQQQQYDFESIVINKGNNIDTTNQFNNFYNMNKHNIKNVQSSYVINSIHDSSYLNTPQQQQLLQQQQNQQQEQQQNEFKDERDFYFQKLKSIDQLLELYEEMNLGEEVDELVFKLKDILYTTPQQQIIVESDSNIVIIEKNKDDQQILSSK